VSTMRLIEIKTLSLVNFLDDGLPRYAILSHCWGGEGEEVTFQEMSSLRDSGKAAVIVAKPGFVKIKDAAALASSEGYEYLWVDTCCIDKTSSAELSEAINSMYYWYTKSTVCYAYLADVCGPTGTAIWSQGFQNQLRASRWFTRGWTLQELIAPDEVVFLANDWTKIGRKGADASFTTVLNNITKIETDVLNKLLAVDLVSVATRMSWASRRNTTRPEDMAYCLMGIFNVNMPLLYGEGGTKAFIRLQEAIIQGRCLVLQGQTFGILTQRPEIDDQSILCWKSPSPGLPDQLHGLLAPSPHCFQFSAWAVPLPSSTEIEPASKTSRGLRVQLQPRYFDGRLLAILGCHTISLAALDWSASANDSSHVPERVRKRASHSQRFSVAIRLRKLGNDQYARLKHDRWYWIPDEAADVPPHAAPVCIYVRHHPTYNPPDTLLGLHSTLPRDAAILYDVYPSNRWNPDALCLRSAPTKTGGYMGLLRFSVKMPGAVPGARMADVLVGFRINSDGEWTCRVRQTLWPIDISPVDARTLFNGANEASDDEKLFYFPEGEMACPVRFYGEIERRNGRQIAMLRVCPKDVT
jgi:hypothetical protein